MTDASRAQVDPRHYLRLVWRWRWLLLGIVVVIPVVVYLISSSAPKTYEASTQLLVQETSITSTVGSNEISVSTSSPQDVAQLIETPVVADVAAKNLGLPASQGRSLLGSITAQLSTPNESTATETNFLTITARAGDPEEAARIATAFADAVTTERTQQARAAIDETVEDLAEDRETIEALGPVVQQDYLENIQGLQSARATLNDKTQVVDPAVAPAGPIAPSPARNTVLGFIFALLLAAAMVPVLDRLDRKIRDVDELDRLVGAPLLSMVPEAAFPGRPSAPHVHEAFQTLRAGLTYFNVDRPLNSLVVAGPSHGEGKTTVAVHLAAAFANDGRDVILVDADLRRASVAKQLGLKARRGLDSVIIGESRLEDVRLEVEGIPGGRLRVIPAVPSTIDPSVLLSSDQMRSLIFELSAVSDLVVIDTPALLIVSDAIPLFEKASGVLMVARINQTRRDQLQRAVHVVESARGKVMGIAATGTKGGGLYGYYDYVQGDNGVATGRSLVGRLTDTIARGGSRSQGAGAESEAEPQPAETKRARGSRRSWPLLRRKS